VIELSMVGIDNSSAKYTLQTKKIFNQKKNKKITDVFLILVIHNYSFLIHTSFYKKLYSTFYKL